MQDVFAALVEKLPQFDYDGQKSFRGWMRTMLLNRWRDQRRRQVAAPRSEGGEALADLPDTIRRRLPAA